MAFASARVLCGCRQGYPLPPRLLAFAVDGIRLLAEIFTSAQAVAAPRVAAITEEVFGLPGHRRP
jgi:hypothetical protein